MKWTTENIESQTGRVALVTGANSGLGFYTSLGLAKAGTTVIMGCRNMEKAKAASEKIYAEAPNAKLDLREVDLGDLASVKRFAEEVLGRYKRLDLLINNAGLMAIPYRKTVDGFEMQFGVNHLGHFALTALLFKLVLETRGSRVVSVSSAAHKIGKIRFEDLGWEKGYGRWKAYGMSKLANLLFIAELQERIDQTELNTIAVAAHPGYADSDLVYKAPEMSRRSFMKGFFRFANRVVAQPAAMGALPSLYAATSPDVVPGGYYGPDGPSEMKGYPRRVYPSPKKMNAEAQKRLWEESQKLTGITFPI